MGWERIFRIYSCEGELFLIDPTVSVLETLWVLEIKKLVGHLGCLALHGDYDAVENYYDRLPVCGLRSGCSFLRFCRVPLVIPAYRNYEKHLTTCAQHVN